MARLSSMDLLLSIIATELHINYWNRHRTPDHFSYAEVFNYLRYRINYIRTQYLRIGLSLPDTNRAEIILFDRLFFLGTRDPFHLIQFNDMMMEELNSTIQGMDIMLEEEEEEEEIGGGGHN